MGLKGGVSRANVGAELNGANVDTGSRESFHVGAVVSRGLSSVFAIEVQGLIVGRGFELTDATSGLTQGANLLYFDFPVLAMVTIPTGPSSMVAPRLFAGPALALRMSCTVPGRSAAQGGSECGLDVAKNVDVQLMLGGGLKIGRGAGGLTVDVAYDHGLVNVNKSALAADLKNRNLLFSVGFLLPMI
jgi:hypothetical protein